jgi:hypothetical protein
MITPVRVERYIIDFSFLLLLYTSNIEKTQTINHYKFFSLQEQDFPSLHFLAGWLSFDFGVSTNQVLSYIFDEYFLNILLNLFFLKKTSEYPRGPDIHGRQKLCQRNAD